MKKTTQTHNDNLNRTTPLAASRPLEIISLFDAAGEFLHHQPKAASEDPELAYAVVALATWLGQLRVDRTSLSDLRAALRLFHPVPQVRQRLVPGIQQFFQWSRAKGYLPAGSPTPADRLEVNTSTAEQPILSLAEVKALLAGTENVELCLATALVLFTGIRSWELEQLRWESIYPGFAVAVPSRRGQPRPTCSYRVPPGLDHWLRPFYGSRGLVLSPRTLRLSLRPLAPRSGIALKLGTLRYTSEAYDLADKGHLNWVARELGVLTSLRRHPPLSHVTEAQARRFFALTPQAVGIQDWPQRVASYLESRRRSHSSKQPVSLEPKP
jgi:integrase